MSQGSSEQYEEREPDEITWVGEQRLMEGYCGRAPVTPAGLDTGKAQELRPVAVVRTRPRQGKVIRIGPPRAAAA